MVTKIKHNFIYGTAWKEDQTEKLTIKALESGFNAIDTANQRKHYNEEGVGNAIASFMKSTSASREDLFIQTKFTHVEGQDHRLPYDPKAKSSDQVNQSLNSSLEHLKTDYIDSYILHGPSTRNGFSERDWDVWHAMEDLVSTGKIKQIGISNIAPDQLKLLLEHVKIKPTFVQNRCFARLGWDKLVRDICKENNIIYQGFSLLTANTEIFKHSTIVKISKLKEKTIPQIIFSFAQQIGMLPITGTSNIEHMRQDLDSCQIELEENELMSIEKILTR